MTLIEVMVVIALVMLLGGVLIGSLGNLLSMQERATARNLAFLYDRLRDEAVMQNVSFRVVYHLNKGAWVVESGEPGMLIHASQEDREMWERQMAERLSNMDEEERKAWQHTRKPFEQLAGGLKQEFHLPDGMVFLQAWTPAWEEPVVPSGEDPKPDAERDPLDPDDGILKVYSHVFSNGTVEETVLWIGHEERPEDGYTIRIAPLSGEVDLIGEIVPLEDLFQEVPDRAPELPN